MPRHYLERDRYLSLDTIAHIKNLFGTLPNAWKRLRLEDVLDNYAAFERAMYHRTITEEVQRAIEDRYWRWKMGVLGGRIDDALHSWKWHDGAMD